MACGLDVSRELKTFPEILEGKLWKSIAPLYTVRPLWNMNINLKINNAPSKVGSKHLLVLVPKMLVIHRIHLLRANALFTRKWKVALSYKGHRRRQLNAKFMCAVHTARIQGDALLRLMSTVYGFPCPLLGFFMTVVAPATKRLRNFN